MWSRWAAKAHLEAGSQIRGRDFLIETILQPACVELRPYRRKMSVMFPIRITVFCAPAARLSPGCTRMATAMLILCLFFDLCLSDAYGTVIEEGCGQMTNCDRPYAKADRE